jgi:thiamine kinase-like enzyme
LWADNILPTPTGGVCVIDWENCGLADPAQELPMVMIDFAFGDQCRIAELYLSYLETGGPARVSGYSSFTMVIRAVQPLLGVSSHRLPFNQRR